MNSSSLFSNSSSCKTFWLLPLNLLGPKPTTAPYLAYDPLLSLTLSDKKFKMPNLISIAVLKEKFYSEEILYSFVTYSSKQHKILDSHLFYIWELPWEHLKIQNLGKGQLQIKIFKLHLSKPV